MKKIVVIYLTLLIVLCSCSSDKVESSDFSEISAVNDDTSFSNSSTLSDKNVDDDIKTDGDAEFMKAVWVSQFDLSEIWSLRITRQLEEVLASIRGGIEDGID